MTEFEINKAVAEKMGFQSEIREDGTWVFNKIWIPFDPCNEPLQAWEIMMKYDISVSKYGSNFIAFNNIMSRYDRWDNENLCCENSIENEKPLVAAMLVFLEI